MSDAKMQKPQGQNVECSISGWIRRYGDDFGFQPMVTAEPTYLEPGTWDKVKEMRKRVKRGQPIFSKDDLKVDEVCASDPEKSLWRGNETWGCQFSPCRQYRYRLWKRWDLSKPSVAFIGLNPSTADENKLDPTLKRLQTFAQSWGFGGMEMLNLFAYRSTDPKGLNNVDDPIGHGNDRAIRLTTDACQHVVCCWGIHGGKMGRSAIVLWAIQKTVPQSQIYCFGLTQPVKVGEEAKKYPQPLHPLYLKSDTKAIQIPWELMELAKCNDENKEA
jgi:hypothetical protein